MEQWSAAAVLVAMGALLFCIHAGPGTSMAREGSLRAAAHIPADHGERCDLESQRDAARQAAFPLSATPLTASLMPDPVGIPALLTDGPRAMDSAARAQPPPSLHHRSVLFRI